MYISYLIFSLIHINKTQGLANFVLESITFYMHLLPRGICVWYCGEQFISCLFYNLSGILITFMHRPIHGRITCIVSLVCCTSKAYQAIPPGH